MPKTKLLVAEGEGVTTGVEVTCGVGVGVGSDVGVAVGVGVDSTGADITVTGVHSEYAGP